MRQAKPLIWAAVCAVLLVVLLTGCGGGTDTTTTVAAEVTTSTTAAAGSVDTTIAGTATTAGSTGASIAVADTEALEKYKTEMQAWVDKYDAELNEKVAALESITDPTNATPEQIKGAQEFAEATAVALGDLEKIEAPTELKAAHQAYVDGLKSMASGLEQFAKALESKKAEDLQAAMMAMAAVGDINAAEAVLEQALGITLTSD
jgi:hypothetical protein